MQPPFAMSASSLNPNAAEWSPSQAQPAPPPLPPPSPPPQQLLYYWVTPVAYIRLPTTVVIHNVPHRLRIDELYYLLNTFCEEHSVEYDCVNMPTSSSNRNSNCGYAFVKFTTHAAAELFKTTSWHNMKWKHFYPNCNSNNVCKIGWAKNQGM